MTLKEHIGEIVLTNKIEVKSIEADGLEFIVSVDGFGNEVAYVSLSILNKIVRREIDELTIFMHDSCRINLVC